MLQLATAVASRVISPVIAQMVVPMLPAVLQALAAQEVQTRPATAVELLVTYHVTAQLMVAWTVPNATSAVVRVILPGTVRTLHQLADSREVQEVSRVAHRLEATAALEALEIVKCNATRAADTVICPATAHRVQSATTASDFTAHWSDTLLIFS
jgi:hypothetical protein